MKESNQPLVSICCLAYNQEKYIKQTLEGILMQKTDFPYEIIIHDDASTDNTSKIILDYEKKYPSIIRTIIQEENQFSKGNKCALNLFKEAKGKYIAFCEGDDYWIDPKKLQKQIEFLLSHQECSLYAHFVKKYIEDQKKYSRTIPPIKIKKINNLIDVLKYSGLIPSLSMVFKTEIIHNLPEVYYQVPYEDLMLKVLCAEKGKIGLINEVMGIYRIHNQNMTRVDPKKFMRMKLKNFIILYNYLKHNLKAKRILYPKKLNLALSLYFHNESKLNLKQILKMPTDIYESIYTPYLTLIFLIKFLDIKVPKFLKKNLPFFKKYKR